MERYDPDRPVDPEEWLELDEDERILLVKRYHRKKGIELPNAVAHATFHVVVENQIAMGDEIPVRETADRLMKEGLSRHDAVHAIGSVLAGHMFDLTRGAGKKGDVNADYYKRLEDLTADAWLADHDEESKRE